MLENLLTNNAHPTQKASKGEQPFLHATHHLDLIYICIPIIITISQRLELFSTQAFKSEVNSREKTQKGSKGEQPFLYMTQGLDLIYIYICIPIIIKISQRVQELLNTQDFPYKVNSREITEKTSKDKQPFLQVTHHLDLIYMYI